MLRLRIKQLYILFNAFIGKFLPVIDYRKHPAVVPAENWLTGEEIIKGHYKSYTVYPPVLPYWVDLFEKGIRFPALFYISFKNCTLIGRGIVVTKDHKLVLESTIFQREYLNKLLKNSLVIQSLFRKPVKQLDRVIPLVNRLSNNYYHWTAECLSQLALMLQQRGTIIESYNLVIAKDAPAFVRESLMALFCWAPEQVIVHDNNEVSLVKDCILIGNSFTRTAQTERVNIYKPSLYRLVREYSLLNIPGDSSTPAHFIISRKAATQRRLIGEEQIRHAFPDKDFALVYIEELSFVQQVQLFRNAEIIIAPHGAGLVNLVYANSSPVVIEIFPGNRKIRDASLFYQVARAYELDYHLLVTRKLNEAQDMLVDNYLLEQIRAVIATPGKETGKQFKDNFTEAV